MFQYKKIISLFLVIVLVLSSSFAAFAHDCDHSTIKITKVFVKTICNETRCDDIWNCVEKCVLCQRTLGQYQDTDYLAHDYVLYKATCNGTMQTWYYRCSRGGYVKTENEPCRNGPHSGNCVALPLSFDSHEMA